MTPPSPRDADATTPVDLVARSGRARNRLAEHQLEIVRPGSFRGSPAVLTRCPRPGCGWHGWFTDAEMTIDHATTEHRPTRAQEMGT
jgi:hypothetical protein